LCWIYELEVRINIIIIIDLLYVSACCTLVSIQLSTVANNERCAAITVLTTRLRGITGHHEVNIVHEKLDIHFKREGNADKVMGRVRGEGESREGIYSAWRHWIA